MSKFVIHQHQALVAGWHYDLRLEGKGVLKNPKQMVPLTAFALEKLLDLSNLITQYGFPLHFLLG